MKSDKKNDVIVIIDAYSTGKELAPALKKEGYDSIHIKSSFLLPLKFSHCEKDFLDQHTYSGNLEELVETLKRSESQHKCEIKGFFPGSESGVELADLLNEKFKFPGNDITYSVAHRNKYEMGEIIKKAGLKIIKQFKSKDSQQIIAWIKRKQIEYPVVLKPLDSASADGVHFCYNPEEITLAHAKILMAKNLFGVENKEVLAQGFNYGQEYIINTVSRDGKHLLAEIWRVSKMPRTTIYDRAEIVHSNEKEYQPLFEYTKKVLDALHIKNGAATTEVKYTPDGGAVLLESAARMMSGAPLSFCEKLFGFNQLSLLIESYLYPNKFLTRLNEEQPPSEKYGMTVVLISDIAGKLQHDLDIEEIKHLSSFHACSIDVKKGDIINRTINTLTAPGEIYLIGDSKQDVLRAYRRIRNAETGLYVKATGNVKNEYGIKEKTKFLFLANPSALKIPIPIFKENNSNTNNLYNSNGK